MADSSSIQAPPAGQVTAARPSRDGGARLLHYWQLTRLLLPAATSRLRYRLLKNAALGIALSQSAVYLMTDAAAEAPALRTRLITATLLYCLILGVCASYVMLSGFWDLSVARLFDALRLRRDYAAIAFDRLEVLAMSLFLTLLLSAPLALVAVVAVTRARSLLGVLELVLTLSQSLLVVGLFATTLAYITHWVGLQKWRYPRSGFALLLFGPELLRLVLPTLPSVRTLLWSLASLVPFWSLPS